MTKEYFEDGQCYCAVCFTKNKLWCECLAHGPWPCGHCQDHPEYRKFYQSLGLVPFEPLFDSTRKPMVKKEKSE